MATKVYINGKMFNKKDAKVSVFDHGLLYGDGIFEGIRSYNKLVFRLKDHVDRLYRSAEAIRLKIPISKTKMVSDVCKMLKANKLSNAYIRLIVTRGVGDLGLDPRKCKGTAQVIIITDKITLYPQEFYKNGLDIITAETQQNPIEALSPHIKSLNYLNNILAKIEAIDAGLQEAIMLNAKGYVTECTGDNIFIIKNGTIYTPPSSVGLLRGVTRDAVIDIAKAKKVKLIKAPFKCNRIYNADECFLTGTAAEIIPVVKVDKKKIGNGKPGKATLMFMEEFKQLTLKDGIRY